MRECADISYPSPVTGWIKQKDSQSVQGRADRIADWTRFDFWLPILIVAAFVLTVSGDRAYAAMGGAEIYNPVLRSNAIRQLSFLSLGLVGSYLLFLAPTRQSRQVAWTLLLPITVLLAYLYSSVLWSDDSVMTFKRATTATCAVLIGLGVGRVWSFHDYCRGLVILSTSLLLVGLLFELRFHAFLNAEEYRFSGAFHPAKQAFNCGILILSSLVLYFQQQRRVFLCLMAFAFALLLLTKARTGTLATIVAATWLIGNYVPARRWMPVALFLTAVLSVGWLFYAGATAKELQVTKIATMGRDQREADPTKLTGRLPIWSHAIKNISERPVLGYGYGAFWTESRLREFARRNGWALAHSHSTYLESLLNLGMVGFTLGSIVMLLAFFRSISLTRRPGCKPAILVSGLIIFALVGGFSEIAFIAMEYETFSLLSGIGVLTFTHLPRRGVP